MYLLVEFTDNAELAVIPDNWLDGNKCAVWPPYKSSSRIRKSTMQKETPSDSWRAYPIRVLYKHESYEKVRSKEKRAEVDSDLQTDTNEQNGRPVRRKRSPERYTSSDSDPEERPRKLPTTDRPKTPSDSLPPPPVRIDIPVLQDTSIPGLSQTSTFESPPSASNNSQPSSSPVTESNTPVLNLPRAPRPLLSPRPITQTPQSLQRSQPDRTPTSGLSASSRPSLAASSSRLQNSTDRHGGTTLARDVRFFTVLEKIREEQQHHTSLLTAIIAKLGDAVDIDDTLPDGVSFPVTSIEEMNDFEDKMKDRSAQKIVVNHLASIGGSSIEDMSGRILKYTMSNSLAEKYNWTGVHKHEFRKLSLPLLVKRAVRRCFRLVTAKDIEQFSKSFLKSAKDRDGGRQRRINKTVTPTTSTRDPTEGGPQDSSDSDTDV